jgi:hypothetical protein
MGRNRSNATAPAVKGDLVAGTGVDTSGVLALGSNGDTLVADSSASTGLAWGVMRGSNRNYCYNSGFDIWQRGTTFAITAVSNTYTADRWQITLNQRTSGTLTINQNTSQKQTADNYCMEVDATALVTNSTINITQILETLDVVPLRGRIVTASVYMKVASGTATVGQLLQDGTDTNAFPSTGTTADSLNASVTTTWTRFSVTHTVASGANSIAWRLSTPSSFAGKLYVSQVQIEVSPTGASNQPTAWAKQNATIQGELAACQRYYVSWNRDAAVSDAGIATGFASSTTSARIYVPLPVRMRTTPTTVDWTASGLSLNEITAGYTVSTLAFTNQVNNAQTAAFNATVASGLTQWRPYFLNVQTTTAFGIGAEL